MDRHTLNLLPCFLLPTSLNTESLISILHFLPWDLCLYQHYIVYNLLTLSLKEAYIFCKTHLLCFCKAHHQLRLPKRQRVTFIHLPEMIRLPIQTNDLFHLLCLCNFPYRNWDVGIRHYKHAALDLSDVRSLHSILRFQIRKFNLEEKEKRGVYLPRSHENAKASSPLHQASHTVSALSYTPLRSTLRGWLEHHRSDIVSPINVHQSHFNHSSYFETQGREAGRRTSELRCVQ
jgi:hypothetical protein